MHEPPTVSPKERPRAAGLPVTDDGGNHGTLAARAGSEAPAGDGRGHAPRAVDHAGRAGRVDRGRLRGRAGRIPNLPTPTAPNERAGAIVLGDIDPKTPAKKIAELQPLADYLAIQLGSLRHPAGPGGRRAG